METRKKKTKTKMKILTTKPARANSVGFEKKIIYQGRSKKLVYTTNRSKRLIDKLRLTADILRLPHEQIIHAWGKLLNCQGLELKFRKFDHRAKISLEVTLCLIDVLTTMEMSLSKKQFLLAIDRKVSKVLERQEEYPTTQQNEKQNR